jgi:hemolysin activation/secretion protein
MKTNLKAKASIRDGLLGASLLTMAGALWAQIVAPPAQVDPAALQRQETQRVMREKQPVEAAEAPDAVIKGVPAAPTLVPMTSGVRFVLRDIRFGPSALLTQAELADLAAGHVGKEVDFSDLTKIVGEVNALYRQHGVLTASASLPQQKIQGGVVVIDLLEARVGQVEVKGSQYTRPNYVAGWFASELGQPLDAAQLEDRIKRFNRSSDVKIGANLRPGASFGLTDVLLELREPDRFQFSVFANNEGTQSVGREQVGVDLAMNGPAGMGDRLSLYVSQSRGATTGALTYSVPVNKWGGRLSASFNQGVTDVVAGPYAALGITGGSQTAQLAVVQPVWQKGNWWFDMAASAGQTHSRNEIGGLKLSDSEIQNATLGATVSGSTDERSLSFGATATHASAKAGGAARRDFTVAQFTGSWVENLGPAWFGVLRATAQTTDDAILTPSLLFQVGGASSARGYEVGALSGDSGYLFNLELHRKLTTELGGHFFFDQGGVRTKGLPSQTGKSIGAGLDLQWGRSVSGNITLGHPLKDVLPDQSKWVVTARVSYAF